MPTRVIRRTKAEPQPCAAAKLPTVDSNHDHPDSESGVLPLDQWASSTGGEIRTLMSLPAHQGLGLAWLPFHHTRVRRQRLELRSPG